MGGDKLKDFIGGLAAAVQLYQRAGKNGFFIECVCLATSIIDGALRTGLILSNQIKENNCIIPEDLLYQRDEDRIISEREVYRRSLNGNIISQQMFNKLEALYAQRNKIVHRYIISDIKTIQVLEVAMEYEKIIPAVNDRIRILENEQIRLGVGMTTPGSKDSDADSDTMTESMIAKKHQSKVLHHTLKKEADK